jgi:pyridoxamine 5'-phosphate oxidase-like protein
MDSEEKMEGLRCLTNHVVPGRWEEVRPPSKTEMLKTSVLSLQLDEVSAKVRSGPPLDPEGDYAIPVWEGVVPIRIQAEEPAPDAHVLPSVRRLIRAGSAAFEYGPSIHGLPFGNSSAGGALFCIFALITGYCNYL